MRLRVYQRPSYLRLTVMWKQRLMWVLWPAFLAAGVLEVLVFAVIDPQELHWDGQPVMWSRAAVYTAAFFVFWGIAIVSNGLTALLAMPPDEINR